MKKILFITAALCLVASSAFAHEMAKRLGLGFVTTSAPIGGRYWFSPKVGLDIGLGLDVDEVEVGVGQTESFTDWRIAGGLPLNLMDVGDRVNFNFLPMVIYEVVDQGGDNDSYFNLFGLLEFEVFVTQDLSVGAAMGLGVELYSPASSTAESTTDITLLGANITEFGVHYYLPGGEGAGE